MENKVITEETRGQKLKNELFYKKSTVYEKSGAAEIDKAWDYAKGYMTFLDKAKTERESVIEGVKMLEAAGFVPYTFGMALKAGDKVYYNNRGKSLFAMVIGTEDISNGIRISAAHIDSPRLDLKQNPVYEDSGMGFLKTHYYGGIKKYQWTVTPLALHGVVTKANGETVDVVIGEDDSDPVFYINDLLPHLGAEQGAKPLSSAIPAESLNILIGSRPFDDENVDEKIKLNFLALLNEKYGIIEEDFLSAEISAVPAFKARDIGLDRSLIGAYGHDDRVCSYPALTALIDTKAPTHTLMCVLADKEEIGSEGNSGMQSRIFLDLIDDICASLGASPIVVRANSKCLSADVSAVFDPNFAEAYERRNSAMLSAGVVMNKYTGARGKSGSNDASAEYIGELRAIFARDGVVWQTAELGKTDFGGGGTVAKYIANENIDTVDLGVAVISMHAPYEVVSKVDLYETYKAFSAFCKY